MSWLGTFQWGVQWPVLNDMMPDPAVTSSRWLVRKKELSYELNLKAGWWLFWCLCDQCSRVIAMLFGDGNLWPFYSSLTCEPCYHKLLTASTGLVNGVTLYELWAWMPAVKHVHMRTQINVHIHTPTDPAPLILHFQPLGPPVEVEGLDQ